MENPYASPTETQAAVPVKSRVLRMAGLTICFFLGGIATLVGFFIIFQFIRDSRPESAAAEIWMLLIALLYYFGFGAAFLLAGVLFVFNRRAWGWTAIAVGIAIPVILTWLFAP